MSTPREVTEPLRGVLIRVPPRGSDVCCVCHGAPNPSFNVCYVCRQVRNQLQKPIDLIVPISLSPLDGRLYRTLSNYARSPHVDVRREAARQVASLIVRFVGGHGRCIRRAAGRHWSAITVVPSSSNRPGPHPLETALEGVGWTLARVLHRGPGRLGDLKASDNGFVASETVAEKSLLLVDDVINTTARLQSAASALRLAGADVVAAVAVARLLNPKYREPVRELLARARAAPFDFSECCLEHERATSVACR
jgi:hypothetical protein